MNDKGKEEAHEETLVNRDEKKPLSYDQTTRLSEYMDNNIQSKEFNRITDIINLMTNITSNMIENKAKLIVLCRTYYRYSKQISKEVSAIEELIDDLPFNELVSHSMLICSEIVNEDMLEYIYSGKRNTLTSICIKTLE